MRKVKTVFSIISCGLVVLLLIMFVIFCTPVGSFLSIGFEDILVKWDINNPYVNKNYSGWKEITLGECVSFKVPRNWTIDETDGIYSVTNATGDLWALGAIYGSESDRFDSYRDFVAEITKMADIEITLDHYPEFQNIRGADIQKILFYRDGSEQSYYSITMMKASGPSFLLVLFCDLDESSDDLDIAEAMMYSFAY